MSDELNKVLRRVVEGEETAIDVIKELIPFQDADGKEKELEARRVVIERRAIQPEPPIPPQPALSKRRATSSM